MRGYLLYFYGTLDILPPETHADLRLRIDDSAVCSYVQISEIINEL